MSPAQPVVLPHHLTVEDIDRVAESFKEDLSRECERRVRRNDNSGALSAIVAKEYIDKFVYALKIRAGSELGRPKEPKKRIRAIYIPEFVKKPPTRVPLAPEEAAEQKHVQEVVAATRYLGRPRHY